MNSKAQGDHILSVNELSDVSVSQKVEDVHTEGGHAAGNAGENASYLQGRARTFHQEVCYNMNCNTSIFKQGFRFFCLFFSQFLFFEFGLKDSPKGL